jgi:hypothetical protein
MAMSSFKEIIEGSSKKCLPNLDIPKRWSKWTGLSREEEDVRVQVLPEGG